MGVLGAAILVGLALLALFVALNWSALTTQTALSFAVFTVDAPLGLILVGVALGFALLFLAYAVMQRTEMLMESRRHAQEIKALRELADRAEASRLGDLRLQLEREFVQLRTTIEQSANGLAASIGEIDDKLDKAATPRA